MRLATLLAVVAPLVNYAAAKVEGIGKIGPYAVPDYHNSPKFGLFDEYESALDMTHRPDNYLEHERKKYCMFHTHSCEHLCGYATEVNTCDHNDFDWQCICSHNDSMPGLQYYYPTLPTTMCVALYEDCRKFVRFPPYDSGAVIGGPDRLLLEQGCEDRILSKCGLTPLEQADTLRWVHKDDVYLVDLERIKSNLPFPFSKAPAPESGQKPEGKNMGTTVFHDE